MATLLNDGFSTGVATCVGDIGRKALTVTTIPITGIEPPAQQDADTTRNHVFENDSRARTFLEVYNDDASDHDVVIEIPGDVDIEIPKTDRTIEVPAGETVLVGSFAGAIYHQNDTHSVFVNPSHADLKFRLYTLS